MSQEPKEIYEFSQFRLEVAERRLSRNGRVVRVPDKAFDTLCVLVSRQGKLLTKDELMAAVWPNSVVEENNLDQKISTLRTVLGERGKGKEKYIETVRGHGYRFVPQVKQVEETTPALKVDAGRETLSSKSMFKAVSTPFQPMAAQRAGNVVAVAAGQQLSHEHSTPEVTEPDDIYPDRGFSPSEAADRPAKHARERSWLLWTLIAGILIALGAIGWTAFLPDNSSRIAAGVSIESIAVLPFENLSADPDTEYLTEGITDSLINHLSQLDGLKVISRSAVIRYKGKSQDTQIVGRDLNVRAVLTGSVAQRGDQMIISARLDDTQSNQQIWGNQFVRTSADLITIQNAISREVAESLRHKLTGDDLKQLGWEGTTNVEAYRLYLRGRFLWNKRENESIRRSIDHFEQALAMDPNFALGYVGLADAQVFLYEFGEGSAPEMLERARVAVDKALRIDPYLAEAHASSGLVHRLTWKWSEAGAAFKRATELNPNYSSARIWHSVHLRNLRNFADALTEIKHAQDVDPLSVVVGSNAAYIQILNGDFDAAIAECNKLIELEPGAPIPHEVRGMAYVKKGMLSEATASFERAVEFTKRRSPRFLTSLGHVYALSGRHSDARRIIKELERIVADGKASGQNVAGVHAGLGDIDAVIRWLEMDYGMRKPLLPEINWRFAFDPVRSDQRFAAFVRRMDLEP